MGGSAQEEPAEIEPQVADPAHMRKMTEEKKLRSLLSEGKKPTELDAKLRKDLIESMFWRMFAYRSKAPKTSFVSDNAQLYLNLDDKDRPVYLQTGWLDRVGFLRDKDGGANLRFEAKEFLNFKTAEDVLGFDHSMIHARLQFTV